MHKTGNVSVTVEDRANVTINGLVIHRLSIAANADNQKQLYYV